MIDVTGSISHVLNYFGVSASDAPTVRIIDMDTGEKFAITAADLTADSLTQLCQEVLDGSAKVTQTHTHTPNIQTYSSIKPINLSYFVVQPYYRSEEIPEDWNKGPVKVLVGKNFESVALDQTKNVFVEFCKSVCPSSSNCSEISSSFIIKHSQVVNFELPVFIFKQFHNIKWLAFVLNDVLSQCLPLPMITSN